MSRSRGRALAPRAAPGVVNVPKLKAFLESLTKLGDVRIIINTGVAVHACAAVVRARDNEMRALSNSACSTQVLESVTTFEGLFYSPVPNKCAHARRGMPSHAHTHTHTSL
jgi:hypothetical protein